MIRIFAVAIVGALISTEVRAESISFFHTVTDKPLEFKYRTDQTVTPAVSGFLATGTNSYVGDEAALADGAKLYKNNCQACHLADGSGKVGPNLTDEEWLRPRTHTDVGRFEIIYGGGGGAMQPFGRRMDQDDILKVMAFIDTFRGGAGAAPAAAPETTQASAAAGWSGKKDDKGRSIPPEPFTDAFLADAVHVEAGGEIWAAQCRHCHGAKAYPGKAPKLKPAKYKPDFVYRRITDGFRKMPAWEEQYTDLERMQITAYILSSSFSP